MNLTSSNDEISTTESPTLAEFCDFSFEYESHLEYGGGYLDAYYMFSDWFYDSFGTAYNGDAWVSWLDQYRNPGDFYYDVCSNYYEVTYDWYSYRGIAIVCAKQRYSLYGG